MCSFYVNVFLIQLLEIIEGACDGSRVTNLAYLS